MRAVGCSDPQKVMLSGIADAGALGESGIEESGKTVVRIAMFGLPAVLVVVSWAVLRAKYRLDEATYQGIVDELREREQSTDA